MSQGSAVHVAVYDQQVFDRSRVPAGQHQNCTHHSLNSAAQSLHICHPKSEKLGHMPFGKVSTSEWQLGGNEPNQVFSKPK